MCLDQGRKYRDISSIYRVSGLLEMIFANESRLKEKSEKSPNISDISVTVQYIRHFHVKKLTKNAACEKIQKKKKQKWPIWSIYRTIYRPVKCPNPSAKIFGHMEG